MSAERDLISLATAPPVSRLRLRSGRVRTVGHRGAMADAPENTFAGFELALAAGVDEVEFDVRLTRDGVPVVFHDATLDRTTDGRGALRDLDWADVAQLDAGAWFGTAHRGQRVPTLDQLCAWIADRPLGMALELKQPAPAEGQRDDSLVPAVLAALRSHGLLGRTVIHSFDHPSIARVVAEEASVATALLYSGPVFAEFLRAMVTVPGITGLHVRWPWVSRELCAAAHSLGVYVHAWGLAEPLDRAIVSRLIAADVDSLSANSPRSLVEIVRAQLPSPSG